jgi:hypothetical protein
VRLAGPTSFAPAIRQACKIVADSGGKFHILLIIADGQVCTSSMSSLPLSGWCKAQPLMMIAASYYDAVQHV